MVLHIASCSQSPLTFFVYTPYALSDHITNYVFTLRKACSVLFHGTGALDHFGVCNKHCKLSWKLQDTSCVNCRCPTFCGTCWGLPVPSLAECCQMRGLNMFNTASKSETQSVKGLQG